VEDEFMVRWDLASRIRDEGYNTVEAENAAEAIVELEGNRSIRVVFTDIKMPGTMDGLRLAHVIRDRWPPTLIVLSSGNIPTDASSLPRDVRLLRKPYGQAELANVLSGIAKQLRA
jgi:CheY-like chemotaxis protein